MIKRFAFLAATMLFALSCSSSTKSLSTSATIKVKSGKNFIVNMKSNPTTGHRWIWANKAEAAADSVSFSYKADENKKPMFGAGGTDTWTFKAKDSGADSLVFYLVPARMADAQPVDTLVFHFDVK